MREEECEDLEVGRKLARAKPISSFRHDVLCIRYHVCKFYNLIKGA